MTWLDAVILLAGGAFTGVINAMAGGGSLLTVPLLDIVGVTGLAANGTNRVGVWTQAASSTGGYRQGGAVTWADTAPVLISACLGSLVGATVISQIPDDAFRTIFGLVMIPMLVLALRRPKIAEGGVGWRPWTTRLVFFGIGVYGGAIQAGVGLVLLLALSAAGYDLVKGNGIKTAVVLAFTTIALPVFIVQGQVEWVPALVLAAGTAAGGWIGARVAVEGGERVIRPVLVVCVVAMAGRMLGLYG